MGTIAIALAALAMIFWLQPWWRSAPALEISFEGLRMPDPEKSHLFATFRIRNVTSKTIYYEGTPYPMYVIEHRLGSSWVPDSQVPQLEVLYPVFPGKSQQFTIPVPDTTNEWRLVLTGLEPMRGPILLRRYRKPRQVLWRSPEINSLAFAAQVNTKTHLATVPAPR